MSFVGFLGARGRRRRERRSRPCAGTPRDVGVGRSGIGRGGIWRGFIGRALPAGGDAQAGVDVGVRPLEVVGRGLVDGLGGRPRRPRAPSRRASDRSSTGAGSRISVSLEAMSRDFLYGMGTQPQVLRRTVGGVVGCGAVARGTSGAFRWYRRGRRMPVPPHDRGRGGAGRTGIRGARRCAPDRLVPPTAVARCASDDPDPWPGRLAPDRADLDAPADRPRRGAPPTPSTAGRALPDRFGRALHDLRISVTDRCNFRCPYCMPAEVFGRDFAFLPQGPGLCLRGDRAAGGDLRRPRASRSCGSPAASRSSGATCRSSSRYLAPLRTADGGPVDLTLTTNGSALRALAAPLAERRPRSGSRSASTRSTTRFRRDERRRLPGVPGARRDRGRPRCRPRRRSRSTWSSGAGMNEASVLPLARWARDEGLILRFIEYMDVGHSNGWRLDDVVPADEILALDLRRDAPRAVAAELPGRGRRPLALPRRDRRAGRHRLGDRSRSAATARGPACRPRATSTRACSRSRAPTSRRRCGTARRTRSWSRRSGRSGRSGPTATRSCAPRRPPTCPRSRCSRWAAGRTGSARLSTGRPQVDGSSWTGAGRSGRSSWISALTTFDGGPYRRSCPKGPFEGPGRRRSPQPAHPAG